MPRQTLLGLTAVLFLAGCNQPAVSLKAPAFQSSENTVRDWDDVAHRIALEMTSIGLIAPITPTQPAAPPPPTRPVFVRVQAPDSAFIQEVASQLESDIQRAGTIVARIPAGATVVNLDVDFVRWSPRDKPPGLTATAAAIYGLPALVIGDSTPMSTWTAADAAASTAFGLGILTDTLIALTPTMNAEAIWKATIVVNNQVVMSLHQPVYVRAGDIALYAKATDLAPISSWSSDRPLPVRQIRYDP
jgi:hypothetical protein